MMPLPEPQLSVVVPVFNTVHYLREAVLSALADRDVAVEVIVVDDGSTDNSIDTIRDLPVRVIRLGRNYGPAVARNVGLSRVRGRCVVFLDSDDRLLPGANSWRLQYLETHLECAAVAGSGRLVDETSTGQNRRLELPSDPAVPMRINHNFFRNGHSLFRPCLTTMFRWEEISNQRFDEGLPYAQDFEFFLSFARRNSVQFFPRPVLDYRVHRSNRSILAERAIPRALAYSALVRMEHSIPLRRPRPFPRGSAE